MFMDLVKLSKRVAKFLNNENVSSLSDIYTHLQKDVFLKDILLSLDGLQFIKLTFLIGYVLEGKNPEELNSILDKNLFLFSVIHFGDSPEIECDSCYGSGSEECSRCDGSGKNECSDCQGESEVECDTCDGSGVDEEGEPCKDCQGGGLVKCESCDGEGEYECGHCDGEGNESCDYCDGSGRVYGTGANYDIEMFASYNPILKETIYNHLNQIKPIDSEKIERKTTFIFNTYDMHDSSENTEIDDDYQNESYVNAIEIDFEEIDFLHKRRNNTVSFSDFENVNDDFK